MEQIISILMERDEMSRTEAVELVKEARDEVMNCGGDYCYACEIIEEYLGLEPDYLMDLIM